MRWLRFGSLILVCMLWAAPQAEAARASLLKRVLPRIKPDIPVQLLSSREREALSRALADAKRGRLERALSVTKAHDRPVADAMLTWVALQRPGAASFETLTEFLRDHPDWPLADTIARRAEAVVRPGLDLQTRLNWFAAHPPMTGAGHLAYGRALHEAGRKEEAAHWLRSGWRTAPLSRSDQAWWLRNYGAYWENPDHFDRASYFLWQRNRSQALRLLPLLTEAQQILVRARATLIAFGYNVDAAVAAVPADLQNDPGLIFDRIYWRRIKGKHGPSQELMLSADVDGSAIYNPRTWWRERHYQARRLLRQGDYVNAYRLAAEHSLTDGMDLTANETGESKADMMDLPRRLRAQIAEAEWLAGWIALRFLERPATALDHFRTMSSVVAFPISLSRAAYWTGRAAQAKGDPISAGTWYAEAAQYDLFYYGQLARVDLGGRAQFEAAAPTRPDFLSRIAFRADPKILGSHYLADLRDNVDQRRFLSELILTAPNAHAQALALELAEDLGRPDAAITAAKIAARSGDQLIQAGYPVIDAPNARPELMPLVLGVTRQESLFYPAARSHAGALGMMQLTPATARSTARKIGLRYNRQRLTSDAPYNLQLGSAHLDQLLDLYDGSYVLALAAYNAGPKPVNRWIRDYGDPRHPRTDVVDWIESIPFSETRNYVQRVLEATAVYDHLTDKAVPPRSIADLLTTGKPKSRAAASAVAAPGVTN